MEKLILSWVCVTTLAFIGLKYLKLWLHRIFYQVKCLGKMILKMTFFEMPCKTYGKGRRSSFCWFVLHKYSFTLVTLMWSPPVFPQLYILRGAELSFITQAVKVENVDYRRWDHQLLSEPVNRTVYVHSVPSIMGKIGENILKKFCSLSRWQEKWRQEWRTGLRLQNRRAASQLLS